MSLDVDSIRSQFPALKTRVNGFQAAFFDAPGGTQTPQRVIDRMAEYLACENSNTHGAFPTSARTDEVIEQARRTFADYFNCSADEVAFCHNSTTISFKLAEAIARDLRPGDEVIITDIDHEANRGPWEILAERGIVVKSVRVDTETRTLDMQDYVRLLSGKVKVVAFNYASNAAGTISDAKVIIRMAKQVGAVTIVDAVHYALHGVIDVRDLNADFLFCSAYKFFGPHIGVLYGKKERMESIRTLRVGAQKNSVPSKFETGTLNHEGIAGAAEAVEFLADIGAKQGNRSEAAKGRATERRRNVVAAMLALEAYEKPLADAFKERLAQIDGLNLYGPPKDVPCTSTIVFRLRKIPPRAVTTRLGEKGIFAWDGHFYAAQLIRSLGLDKSGGLVRFGLAPYNTQKEIDRAVEEIERIASGK